MKKIVNIIEIVRDIFKLFTEDVTEYVTYGQCYFNYIFKET